MHPQILKKIPRRLLDLLLAPLYWLINLFLIPVFRLYYSIKIKQVPRDTQLFFMTRFDLGTWLFLIQYAQSWQEQRGPASLVIFTAEVQKAKELIKIICPKIPIISIGNVLARVLLFFFPKERIQFHTFIPTYAFACCQWPHALYLFDTNATRRQKLASSRYIQSFDPILKTPWPFSKQTLQAYLNTRKFSDCRRRLFEDMIQLQKNNQKKQEKPRKTKIFEELKINERFIILNLNSKYYPGSRINRSVQAPQRYNALIDFLIEKGYDVVIQGRGEQPFFRSRKGLIDYSRSTKKSLTNDFILYSHSSFGILNKTGPEVFCSIANVPLLGLNYTELSCCVPNGRSRFFPKHLWHKKEERYIYWRELLQRPCFYDLGSFSYENEIEYIDLTEEDLIAAIEEFLEMLQTPDSSWINYTPLQKEFKHSLHPAHLDLYKIVNVPCDVYLKQEKTKEPDTLFKRRLMHEC